MLHGKEKGQRGGREGAEMRQREAEKRQRETEKRRRGEERRERREKREEREIERGRESNSNKIEDLCTQKILNPGTSFCKSLPLDLVANFGLNHLKSTCF